MSRQFLKLEPESELKFRGPFTNIIAIHLKLTSLSDKPVLFKIKTTAPKRYCVRPNCGPIKPNEVVDIAVILQPFTYDPQDKNKHKFMVQSMLAPEDFDSKNLDAVFKSALQDSITENKLKCVFEMPEEQEIKPVKSNAVSSIPVNPASVGTTNSATDEGLPDRASLINQINQLKDENRHLELRLVVKEPFAPDKSANTFPPILHIILAFLLGLIIGKYIL